MKKTASMWPPLQLTECNEPVYSRPVLSQTNVFNQQPASTTNPTACILFRMGGIPGRCIEGAMPAKPDILEKIDNKNSATVILLQETHKENLTDLKLPGFVLAGHIKSNHHGLATVRESMPWSPINQAPADDSVEWTTTIVNVNKPPPSQLEQGLLSDAPAQAVYAGNFNSWHTDWGYRQSNQNGIAMSTNPKSCPPFAQGNRTLKPTQTWHSPE